MIVLSFGQPGAGKTTLAIELITKLCLEGIPFLKFIWVDGDRWRLITKNTDYSRQGRMLNLKTAFDMDIYLEKENYIPVLSFISPYQKVRTQVNEQKLCECSKGIYSQEIKCVDRGRQFIHGILLLI